MLSQVEPQEPTRDLGKRLLSRAVQYLALAKGLDKGVYINTFL